jgi:hypothetical protein
VCVRVRRSFRSRRTAINTDVNQPAAAIDASAATHQYSGTTQC